jgi:hypothetical protein
VEAARRRVVGAAPQVHSAFNNPVTVGTTMTIRDLSSLLALVLGMLLVLTA